MNIFVLDTEITKAAEYHNNKHVNKMILESAQMMCTIANEQDIQTAYKSTHPNHPCTKWLRESFSNFIWLRELIIQLNVQYRKRFCHAIDHKSFIVAMNIPFRKLELPKIGLTPFALAMPEQYKHPDPVIAYRQYYMGDKRHIAKWSNGKPYWWK